MLILKIKKYFGNDGCRRSKKKRIHGCGYEGDNFKLIYVMDRRIFITIALSHSKHEHTRSDVSSMLCLCAAESFEFSSFKLMKKLDFSYAFVAGHLDPQIFKVHLPSAFAMQ